MFDEEDKSDFEMEGKRGLREGEGRRWRKR